MATLPMPMQPELRAYPVFDEVPARCIAHYVTDADSLPILRPGEVALIDLDTGEPEAEELFLVQWGDGTRSIRVPWHCTGTWAGEFWIGRYHQPNGLIGVRAGDGPYSPDMLRAKIVGRVVGILQPIYVEPLRLAA